MEETISATDKPAHIVALVSIGDSGDLIFHQDHIDSVFNNAAIREIPVGIVSVIGEDLMKSSIMLNLVNFVAQENRMTIDPQFSTLNEIGHGIVTLREHVLLKLDMDRKLALFFMTTSNSSTQQANYVKFWGILATVSSHMVFLTSPSIQAEDLIWLHNLERKRIRLQQLTILVQNWYHPKGFLFGVTGGKKFLEQLLQAQSGTSDLLRKVVRQIDCVLMPREEDPSFHNILTQFFSRTVGRMYLSPKELNGQEILCRNIPNVFESYRSVSRDDTCDTEADVIMDTGGTEDKGDAIEAMDVDPPTPNLDFDEGLQGISDSSAISNSESSKHAKSVKISLDEYLKHMEITDKPPKSVKVLSSGNFDEKVETQFSPQDILKKYAKPTQNSHLELPENPIVIPPVTEQITFDENAAIDLISAASLEICTASSIETTSTHNNYFDTRETSNIGVSTHTFASNIPNIKETQDFTSSIPIINETEDLTSNIPIIDKTEDLNFAESLRTNLIDNLRRIPILHSHDKAKEYCYEETLQIGQNASIPSEQTSRYVRKTKLRKKLDFYFNIWRNYERKIGELYSSPSMTSTELGKFYERFRKEWLSVKPHEFDDEIEKIIIDKLEATLRMVSEQLETARESIKYAIMVAEKYYQQEMTNLCKSHEGVKEKIVGAFIRAVKFQNESWEQFYTNELSKKLDKLKPLPPNITALLPPKAQGRDQKPRISQTTEKSDSELRALFSKAILSCVRYYQAEMDRDMKFGRVKELSQLENVHDIARDQSVRKFKKETSDLSGQLSESSLADLRARINREYASYKSVMELKLENDKQKGNSSQNPSVQQSTPAGTIYYYAPPKPAAINYAPTKPAISHKFIGIHVGNSYIKGGFLVNGIFKILPDMGQAKLSNLCVEGLGVVFRGFKSYFEDKLQSNFEKCVITVPVSMTAEGRSQLTIAAMNVGVESVEIITETCALAFGILKERHEIEKLIVLLCNSGEYWSAGAYHYDKSKGTVSLLFSYEERSSNVKFKKEKGHGRAVETINHIKDKIGFKKCDILLVGVQSEIVSIKQKIARNNPKCIHLKTPDKIVEVSTLYASEIFEEGTTGMRICANKLNPESFKIVQQKGKSRLQSVLDFFSGSSIEQ